MEGPDNGAAPDPRSPDDRLAAAPLWPLLRVAAPPGVSSGMFPVRVLAPIRKGLLTDDALTRLCLFGPDGVTPMASISGRPLSHWLDGTVKWLVGSSSVFLRQEETARMVMRTGAPPADEACVALSRDEMGLLVDTGRLRASFPLSGGFPLGNIWLVAPPAPESNGGPVVSRIVSPGDGVALEATTSAGGPYRSLDAPTGQRVLEQSRHVARILFEGALVDDSGATGARYALTVTAHADVRRLELLLSLSTRDSRAHITGARLVLNTPAPVTQVQLDDPSDDEACLDVSLDSDEWLSVSTGWRQPARVDVSGQAASHLVAEGERGGHWLSAGFSGGGVSLCVLDSRCDEISLSAGGSRVSWSVRLPEHRMAPRLTYELAVVPDLAETLADTAASAVAACAGPVTALPETDYLTSTGALPSSLSLLEWFSETGSEMRVAFAELTPETPHRENAIGTLIYALLQSSPELMTLGQRRARRWFDEGAPPTRAPAPAGAAEILEAVLDLPSGAALTPAGAADSDEAEDDVLVALTGARGTDERLLALPGLARAIARLGPGEPALAGVSVLRSLRPSEGSPELRVLCVPPLVEALLAVGLDPDVVGTEFFAIRASEDPVLLRPGDSRSLALALYNGLDVEWTANVFASGNDFVSVVPAHVRAHLMRRSTVAAHLTLSCSSQADEGERRTVALSVAPTGIFGKIPPQEITTMPARDLAGHVGVLPAPVAAALDEYAMPLTRIEDPLRAALDYLDLLFIAGDAHRELIRDACDRSARADCVVVCIGLRSGVWFSAHPDLRLEIEPHESSIAEPLVASDALFTRPFAILPPRLRVSHHIVRMGEGWDVVASDETDRPVIVRADRPSGAVIASLPLLSGEEGTRFGRNLVEWALGAAGI